MLGAESLDARHFFLIGNDRRVSGSPPCIRGRIKSDRHSPMPA
jgi:hypothetical protein